MEGAFLIGPGGHVTKIERGRGETPACPTAKFQRGDIVRVRRNKRVGHFPPLLTVLVAVPPGFSPDDALADLLGEPRSLMTRVGVRSVTYILANEGDPKPYLCREADLMPSGEESVDIGSVSRTPALKKAKGEA